MTRFRRYAIYWAPPSESAFASFGAAWLGWDAEKGLTVPQPGPPRFPVPVANLTARPRRYGFHATLKAPFRLRATKEAAALSSAVHRLAARLAPFDAPPLQLAWMRRFIALVPSGPCAQLSDLGACCVEGLHDFAVRPPEAELNRRRPGLTPRQDQLLEQWFYPYVFDQFRFHLTLTDAPDPVIGEATFETLRELTAPFCAAPVPITELCLFGEGDDSRFRLIERFPLKGRDSSAAAPRLRAGSAT